MSNVMPLETKPLGASYNSDESDICELDWGEAGLRILVALWSRPNIHQRRYIEYFWSGATRHRILEESELEKYWDEGDYQPGKLLFEVISGGWISNAKTERINIWFGREWLIFTSNYSATIISSSEPLIREIRQ